jgi:hypothetical protein
MGKLPRFGQSAERSALLAAPCLELGCTHSSLKGCNFSRTVQSDKKRRPPAAEGIAGSSKTHLNNQFQTLVLALDNHKILTKIYQISFRNWRL